MFHFLDKLSADTIWCRSVDDIALILDLMEGDILHSVAATILEKVLGENVSDILDRAKAQESETILCAKGSSAVSMADMITCSPLEVLP